MSNPEINFNNINSFGYYLLNSTMIRKHLSNNKANIFNDAFGKYVLFKEVENRYNITLGIFKIDGFKKGKSFICIKDLCDNIYYLNNKATECIQFLIDENQNADNSQSNQHLPKPYHLENNEVINTTGYLNKSLNNTNAASPFSKNISKRIHNEKFLSSALGISESNWRMGTVNIKSINDFFDSLTFDFRDIYVLSSEAETISYNENPPILKLSGNIIRINDKIVVALNNTFQFEFDDSYIYLPKDILSQNLTPIKYFYPRRRHYTSYQEAKEAIKKMQSNDFIERQERLNKKIQNISKDVSRLERQRESHIKNAIKQYDDNIKSKKSKYEKLSKELERLNEDFDKRKELEII